MWGVCEGGGGVGVCGWLCGVSVVVSSFVGVGGGGN